jgi:hypothetical protein
MTSEPKHLFVSYAQQDAEIVSQFVAQLRYELRQRQTPVDVWLDREELTPGANWEKSIEEAIRTSVGVLFFVSPASARSERAAREVGAALGQGRLILPIVLGDVSSIGDVPFVLRELNFVQIQTAPTSVHMAQAAVRVADAIDSWLRQHPQTLPPLVAPEAKKFAEEAAESVRAAISRQTEDDQAPPEIGFCSSWP